MSAPIPTLGPFVPDSLLCVTAALSAVLVIVGLLLWGLHEPPFFNTRVSAIGMVALGSVVFVVSVLGVMFL